MNLIPKIRKVKAKIIEWHCVICYTLDKFNLDQKYFNISVLILDFLNINPKKIAVSRFFGGRCQKAL